MCQSASCSLKAAMPSSVKEHEELLKRWKANSELVKTQMAGWFQSGENPYTRSLPNFLPALPPIHVKKKRVNSDLQPNNTDHQPNKTDNQPSNSDQQLNDSNQQPKNSHRQPKNSYQRSISKRPQSHHPKSPVPVDAALHNLYPRDQLAAHRDLPYYFHFSDSTPTGYCIELDGYPVIYPLELKKECLWSPLMAPLSRQLHRMVKLNDELLSIMVEMVPSKVIWNAGSRRRIVELPRYIYL
jgi:hypothetical protein